MTLQLSAPLLDACVLAVLAEGETYGYALTQRLQKELDISGSTLYPVLRRLQKEGCLTVRDRQYQGRNRRYYAITWAGSDRLEELRGTWRGFRGSVDDILLGGTD